MPALTSEERDHLSDDAFALPGRRYPIPDENHARNALARVSQHGTDAEKSTVRAAVHKKYPNIGTALSARPAYALLLDAADRLSPITLANAPATDSEGNPIHYRRLPVAECKSWTHRGTGEPFTIDHARADEWQRNVAAMSGAGFKPFLTFKHTIDPAGQVYDPDARDTAGYVERIVREGDKVYADCSIYGDENLKIAARNSRSLCSVSRDMLDASGNKYTGETWHHLALVPNAALPNLGGTLKIAASASAPASVIPIYILDSNQRNTMPLSAELAAKARTAFNIGADVTDDKLADAVATKALALSGDVTSLTSELSAAKTLALSANPKTYDDMTLIMLSESAQTKLDAALAAGVTPAVLTEIQGIYCVDGKPTGAALTLSAGRPVYFRVLEAVAKIKPVPLGAIPKAGLTLAGNIPSGEPVVYDEAAAAKDPQMQLMQQQTAGARPAAK